MTDERRRLLIHLWQRLRHRDLKWVIHERIMVDGETIRAPDPEVVVRPGPGPWIERLIDAAPDTPRVVTFRVEHFPDRTYGVFVEGLCVEVGCLVL